MSANLNQRPMSIEPVPSLRMIDALSAQLSWRFMRILPIEQAGVFRRATTTTRNRRIQRRIAQKKSQESLVLVLLLCFPCIMFVV